jgi:hypothetical protein
MDFEKVLGTLQIVCRAFGIWGIFLMATAAGLDVWGALLTAAIFSLGAMIAGPSVLTFEYEPTPRALALPLVFLGIGLMSRSFYTASGIAAAAAFVIHAPTTVPFWIVLVWLSRRDWRRTAPMWGALLCALVILVAAERLQPSLREQQAFFTRLTAPQESVQRMRAAYNWISIWWRSLIAQYVLLYVLGLVAFFRVKRDLTPELQAFAVILPGLGMLSMPISAALLEQLKWALVPQLQPMRVLLFVTAFCVILGSFAAIKAKNILESTGWFLLVLYIPMRVQLFDPPTLRVVLTALGLAVLTAVSRYLPRQALPIAGVLAFIVIPGVGHVSNYPDLHTPEVDDLSRWARENTPREAMFLFPDAEHKLYPGLFRVQASRAVYVDWKSGGQVNYLKDFAGEWSARWQAIHSSGYGAEALPQYRKMGIEYVVLQRDHRLAGIEPVYRNTEYAVYRPVE